jgi:hypothetical protein
LLADAYGDGPEKEGDNDDTKPSDDQDTASAAAMGQMAGITGVSQAVTKKTKKSTMAYLWAQRTLSRPPKNKLDSIHSCWNPYYRFCNAVCAKMLDRDWFKNIRDAIILINIIFLGIKHYDQNETHTAVQCTS